VLDIVEISSLDGGHRLLAENWARKACEYEHKMDVIRDSTRRMARVAAAAAQIKSAAE
jgi:hypothetical protein